MSSHAEPRGYADDKAAIAKRLHRIEGQVRGIEKMVEDDRYCIDILTQISAVSTALEAVALKILDDHVSHCVAGALASGDEAAAAEKTAELLAAVQRFARDPLTGVAVDGEVGQTVVVRSRLMVGLLVAALSFGALTSIAAAQHNSKKLTLKFLSLNGSTRFKKDTPPSAQTNTGDILSFRDDLVNAQKQLGRPKFGPTGSDAGTVSYTTKGELYNGTASVVGGLIRFKGYSKKIDSTHESIPVTGGTRQYKGAKGTLVFFTGKSTKPLNVYNLTLP